MELKVVIPKDKLKLQKGIIALEWQLKQDADVKSKEIHRHALEQYKAALKAFDEK